MQWPGMQNSEVQVNIQYVAFNLIYYNLPVLLPQPFPPPHEALDTRYTFQKTVSRMHLIIKQQ